MVLKKSLGSFVGRKAKSFTAIDPVNFVDFSLDNEIIDCNGFVLIFMCNHCPYVVHIIDQVVKVYNKVKGDKIKFIAINSNDVKTYQEDSPERMKVFANNHSIDFPYLYDETQNIAKLYGAVCTPEFYVFNKENVCVYQGRFDESTPGNNIPTTGNDLHDAIKMVVNNNTDKLHSYPSVGCSIKWKTK